MPIYSNKMKSKREWIGLVSSWFSSVAPACAPLPPNFPFSPSSLALTLYPPPPPILDPSSIHTTQSSPRSSPRSGRRPPRARPPSRRPTPASPAPVKRTKPARGFSATLCPSAPFCETLGSGRARLLARAAQHSQVGAGDGVRSRTPSRERTPPAPARAPSFGPGPLGLAKNIIELESKPPKTRGCAPRARALVARVCVNSPALRRFFFDRKRVVI